MSVSENPSRGAAGQEAASLRLPLLGLGLATLGWASAFILGKRVLTEMTPLGVATWRYAFASVVLLPFALRLGAAPGSGTSLLPLLSHPPWRDLREVIRPLAVMVVAGGVLYPWLFLGALKRTSATNTSLLIALNPVMTLVLTPLVGERLERRRMLGASLAFLGAVVVISGADLGRVKALDLNLGDLLAIVAAACWASFNLASRPVVGRISPAVANCTVYAGGFATLFLIAEDPIGQLIRATPATIAGVAAMALLSSVIAGQLFLIGVRAAGVGRAVVFVYLVPVLTAAFSVLLLDEPFAAAQAVGGCAVLAGLWMATNTADRANS
jgi:drug/metabolite transporter (DMT)-like permease